MPLRVKCPGCGKTIKTGDDWAGKKAKCPNCSTIVQFPAQSKEIAPAPTQKATELPDEWLSPGQVKEITRRNKEKRIAAKSKAAGKPVAQVFDEVSTSIFPNLADEVSTSIFPNSANESKERAPFDFKNASPQQRNVEYNRIAREIGDDRFFTRKELNHLPEMLAEGEQVLAFTSGFMDGHTWLITLTDRRIIFLDKGMFYGLKQAAVELDKVNAVAGTTGMFLGEIIIQDGANSRIIKHVWKRTVIPFTNKVRDAIHALKAPPVA